MFNKAKNIETAFQHIRLFTACVVAASFLFSVFVAYESFKKTAQAQQQVYILSSGKVLEALASDRKENIPVEAKDHITVFHEAFFSLDPDEKVIAATVTKALYLADGSVKQVYDNLKESGYYAGIISGNISQRITVDSIQLDITNYPFYFRCFATERITRPTSTVTRSLVTEGYLRDQLRSDHNPHGFLIERWSIVENKDIDIQNR
jgi:conjugative transposon TraK protein